MIIIRDTYRFDVYKCNSITEEFVYKASTLLKAETYVRENINNTDTYKILLYHKKTDTYAHGYFHYKLLTKRLITSSYED